MYIKTALAALFPRAGTPAPDAFQPGRVIEICGNARATYALHHCLKIMEQGQIAAWITPGRSFSPLIALEALKALPRLLTVHVPDGAGVLRAADLLLGCEGAASIAVLDLPRGTLPTVPQLIRLQRRAERSSTLLMVLNDRAPSAPTSGVAVSLRLSTWRQVGANGETTLIVRPTRQKWGAPAQDMEVRDGPDRLRFHRTL